MDIPSYTSKRRASSFSEFNAKQLPHQNEKRSMWSRLVSYASVPGKSCGGRYRNPGMVSFF